MQDNGKLKVLSTTAIVDDLVSMVGQDRIDHLPLIIGEIDPHSYELVKGDDEKFLIADIVFANGLGLEHGASLRYRLESHENVVALGDEIYKQCPECILKADLQYDPHCWMDVSLWARAVDPIVAALSAADPEGAEVYQRNGQAVYLAMLQADQEIAEHLKAIPSSKRYLVSSHDAFNYFTKRYLAEPSEEGWQNRFAAPEGLAPEGQLSVSDIQKVIDHLGLYQIGVVFPESNVSRHSLKKIISACQSKGLQVRIADDILYGDAMGSPGSDADTYLKMIWHNVHALEKEWIDERSDRARR
jgi:manganese/zinc/iron transport system substrate-binding protein